MHGMSVSVKTSGVFDKDLKLFVISFAADDMAGIIYKEIKTILHCHLSRLSRRYGAFVKLDYDA